MLFIKLSKSITRQFPSLKNLWYKSWQVISCSSALRTTEKRVVAKLTNYVSFATTPQFITLLNLFYLDISLVGLSK